MSGEKTDCRHKYYVRRCEHCIRKNQERRKVKYRIILIREFDETEYGRQQASTWLNIVSHSKRGITRKELWNGEEWEQIEKQ